MWLRGIKIAQFALVHSHSKWYISFGKWTLNALFNAPIEHQQEECSVTVSVDIGDRLYDYTDEEKAAEAVAEFQADLSLKDEEIVAIWSKENDPRRAELERRIFDAVDANGTAKRASESVPGAVSLFVEN